MERKKRKSLREQFEENYTAVPVSADNARGYRMKYVYYAPWHMWDLPREQLFRRKWMLMYLGVAGFFLNLLSMLRRHELNHMTVGIILCALILCCHVMEFTELIRFLCAPHQTTRMTFREVDRGLNFFPLVRCMGGLVFAGVFLWYGLTGNDASALLPALGYGLAAITGGVIARSYGKIPTAIRENDTLDHYDQEQEEAE